MIAAIRPAGPQDFFAWAEMRLALWPEHPLAGHMAEIEEFFGTEAFQCFVAEEAGRLLGFAEASIRPFANGCESRPVAFLEGIWIEAASRRKGLGLQLVEAVEAWARARGLKELGSDTEIERAESQQAHAAWGFEEIERTVNYRKKLEP